MRSPRQYAYSSWGFLKDKINALASRMRSAVVQFGFRIQLVCIAVALVRNPLPELGLLDDSRDTLQ